MGSWPPGTNGCPAPPALPLTSPDCGCRPEEHGAHDSHGDHPPAKRNAPSLEDGVRGEHRGDGNGVDQESCGHGESLLPGRAGHPHPILLPLCVSELHGWSPARTLLADVTEMSSNPLIVDAQTYANAADYAARRGNYRKAAELYKAALYVLRTVVLGHLTTASERSAPETRPPRLDKFAPVNAAESGANELS